MTEKENKVEIYSEEIGCYYYVNKEQWEKWEKDDTIFLNRFYTFSTFSTISEGTKSLSRKSSIFLLVLTMSSRGVKASNIKRKETNTSQQGIVKIHKSNYDCLKVSKDGASYNFNEEGVLVKTKHAYKLDAQLLGKIRHKLGYSKNYFSNKLLVNDIVKYVIKDVEGIKPRNFVFIKALPPNLLNDEVG